MSVCKVEMENYESILNKSGYSWEKYEVTTEDGYINSMYRIPFSKTLKTNNNEKRPPVILGHGMSSCSSIFFNQSRLAYYLADEGYDVWLPNKRGTTLSRKHATLDADRDKEEYWNFSWHEIGVYDLPAFVDFVLDHTGYKKVYYVGHSQGTTAQAVLLSEKPEYNEKIILNCFMACSVATEFNITSLGLLFLVYIFFPLLVLIDQYVVRICQDPFSYFLKTAIKHTNGNSLGRYLNLSFMFSVTGYSNFEQASELDLNKFVLTEPNSYSIRQLFHYLQLIRNRRFAKYDYGSKMNFEKYGSAKPPEYNLAKITSPVALFYGKNDMYNDYKKDKLEQKMANVVHVHVVEDELFNHIDFVTAKDSIPLLYSHIVRIMRRFKAE